MCETGKGQRYEEVKNCRRATGASGLALIHLLPRETVKVLPHSREQKKNSKTRKIFIFSIGLFCWQDVTTLLLYFFQTSRSDHTTLEVSFFPRKINPCHFISNACTVIQATGYFRNYIYKIKKKWHIQKDEEVKLFSLLWCLFVFCTAGHLCNMHRNARRMSESCSLNLEDEMVKGIALNSARRHIVKCTFWSTHCHFSLSWVCYHQGKSGCNHVRQYRDWDLTLFLSDRVWKGKRGRFGTKEICASFFFRAPWIEKQTNKKNLIFVHNLKNWSKVTGGMWKEVMQLHANFMNPMPMPVV